MSQLENVYGKRSSINKLIATWIGTHMEMGKTLNKWLSRQMSGDG